MKVHIGPFIYRWSTRRVEDWWYEWRHGENVAKWARDDSKIDKLDKWVETACDTWQFVLNMTINKIIDKKKRKLKVKIDRYDVWATEFHLALIILPMLENLKNNHHGYGFIKDEDVPENIRSVNDPNKGEWDDNFMEARFDWLLEELIWTFTQLSDEDNEDQFYSEITPPKDSFINYTVDNDALKSHNNRISNGLILFGKYFRSLSG